MELDPAEAAEAAAAQAAAEEAAKLKALEAEVAESDAPKAEAAKASAEEDKEKERDAPADARPKVGERARFLLQDCTMNAVPADTGGLLMALREGGCRFLAAGARASLGVRAGRYMFEVKGVEELSEGQPAAKPILRIGFSLRGSSPLVGDAEDSICFDSDGFLWYNKKKTKIVQKGRPWKGAVVAVVMNLEKGGPNAGTISLFVDGARETEPQRLPDPLLGQALYPTVMFKCVSVHVNFGPAPHRPLPFQCRLLEDAAAADVAVEQQPSSPKPGGCEVLFPVFLPDQGAFDWADEFLEKNPRCKELSDRAMVDWALRSNLVRNKALSKLEVSSDKPGMGFGLPALDDSAALKAVMRFAPLMPRDFLVMEVRGNLLKADREAALKNFVAPAFKKVAVVMIGEPGDDFKRRTQQLVLKGKQDKLDAEHSQKRSNAERARQVEAMKKTQQRMANERKRKLEATMRAKERAAKIAKGEKVEDPKEEEPPKEEEESVAPIDDELLGPAPRAVLSEEEKQMWFRKAPGGIPDIAMPALTSAIAKFSLPEREEGFDEIRYQWYPKEKATEHFNSWVRDRKKAMPMDDLQPSDWFRKKHSCWVRDMAVWQTAHKAYQAREAKEAAEAKVAKEAREAKEGKALGAVKDVSKAKDDRDPTKFLEQEMKQHGLDVFAVENICDVGGGVPLFAEFGLGDWALLSLRYELHLVVHALRRDCPDPDRRGIRVEQMPFYYSKYFKKPLATKSFGFDTMEAVLEYIEDTIGVDPSTGDLESFVAEDHTSNDIFVKLAEESRRFRQRRVLTGEENVLMPAIGIAPATAIGKAKALATPLLTLAPLAPKLGSTALARPSLPLAPKKVIRPTLPATLVPTMPTPLVPGKIVAGAPGPTPIKTLRPGLL
uniref:SPRY domain-containing protein n=1 Tax=Zooxanthella nutricula TaxID=1333877 RepID=A0A7S2LEP9_9DINO